MFATIHFLFALDGEQTQVIFVYFLYVYFIITLPLSHSVSPTHNTFNVRLQISTLNEMGVIRFVFTIWRELKIKHWHSSVSGFRAAWLRRVPMQRRSNLRSNSAQNVFILSRVVIASTSRTQDCGFESPQRIQTMQRRCFGW
jgi:hypothetical protein